MLCRILDKTEKQKIARQILEALPEWFEVEEGREEYIAGCVDWIFIADKEGDSYAGFLCLKETGNATVELAVMGVRKDYHRQGIGKQLVEKAKEIAREEGYSFMQVKLYSLENMKIMTKRIIFTLHAVLKSLRFSRCFGMRLIPARFM